jgi:hypothetical protein
MRIINAADFGMKEDGEDCSAALQRAIDAAEALLDPEFEFRKDPNGGWIMQGPRLILELPQPRTEDQST